MADKELRRMNRTELIEIIYALQQNDKILREQNEELNRRLEDKLLRIEKAGSIAEAAADLNHIFEDAENAARQYLDSVRNQNLEAEQTLAEAREQAAELLASARSEKENMTERAQQTEEKCRVLREQTEKECAALREKAEAECAALREQTETECAAQQEQTTRDVKRMRAAFVREARKLLKENPELANRMFDKSGT